MEVGPLTTRLVVSVRPNHTIRQAARLMAERNVGSAVVETDEGFGIITERDLLRAIADTADIDDTRVERYMTSTAITVSEAHEVRAAARAMIEGGFRHLLVLGDDGRVRGILSIRDLVAALLDDPGES